MEPPMENSREFDRALQGPLGVLSGFPIERPSSSLEVAR